MTGRLSLKGCRVCRLSSLSLTLSPNPHAYKILVSSLQSILSLSFLLTSSSSSGSSSFDLLSIPHLRHSSSSSSIPTPFPFFLSLFFFFAFLTHTLSPSPAFIPLRLVVFVQRTHTHIHNLLDRGEQSRAKKKAHTRRHGESRKRRKIIYCATTKVDVKKGER